MKIGIIAVLLVVFVAVGCNRPTETIRGTIADIQYLEDSYCQIAFDDGRIFRIKVYHVFTLQKGKTYVLKYDRLGCLRSVAEIKIFDPI